METTLKPMTWEFLHGRLREIRAIKGFSSDELAKLIGCTGQTILNWENAKSAPTVRQLVDLANALAIDPTAFFRRED